MEFHSESCRCGQFLQLQHRVLYSSQSHHTLYHSSATGTTNSVGVKNATLRIRRDQPERAYLVARGAVHQEMPVRGCERVRLQKLGPVAVSCRSKCSSRPPCVRTPWSSRSIPALPHTLANAWVGGSTSQYACAIDLVWAAPSDGWCYQTTRPKFSGGCPDRTRTIE